MKLNPVCIDNDKILLDFVKLTCLKTIYTLQTENKLPIKSVN